MTEGRTTSPVIGILAFALVASTSAVVWWLLHEKPGVHRQGDGRNPETYGFSLSEFSLERSVLTGSGLPRDSIPVLENPGFLPASRLASLGRRFLLPSDPVVGVVLGNEARAYPLRVLVFHELVNDVVGGRPILVVHQPLCGLTAVLSRNVQQQTFSFGHSGLLWNSCGLVYDRETQTLWLPLAGQAVAGPELAAKLEFLPFTLTTWARWVAEHPETTIVQPDRTRLPQYRRDPYSSYQGSELLRFPVKPPLPPPYRPKLPLIVLNPGTQPLVVVGEGAEGVVGKVLAAGSPTEQVTLRAVGRPPMFEVRLQGGATNPPILYTFAFAWYALHPDQSPKSWVMPRPVD